METVLSIAAFLAKNYAEIISGVIGVISAVIALCLIIPGEFPEKQLQSVLDFLKKFSKK